MLKSPIQPERLKETAERFGTPTYVYLESVIRERISMLKQHLSGIPFQLSYACKANAALPILRLMLEEGLGIDAVSPAELELALRLGFPTDRILYSANNMSDAEMSEVASAGVTLNIGELSRLEAFSRRFPGSPVCVRLNPNIGAGHHDHVITAGRNSKFGIPVDQVGDIRSILRRHDMNLVGMHQHIGSGIVDTDVLWKAMTVMLDVAMDFESLTFINLGGGLGIPYRPEDSGLDFEAWSSKIVAPLGAYMDRHPSGKLTFVFEPGRYFVAECGSLLVTVNTLKEAHGKLYAGVDSGMGHLVRPAIYGAYHAIYNLSNPAGSLKSYEIVGNICESADFFAKDRPVQEISEGDLLSILDAGAYGMSMASNYNLRPAPAEVWLPADLGEPVLISGRESAQQMIDRMYPSLNSVKKTT